MVVGEKDGRVDMATSDKKTKLIVDIPTDLKKDFKVYCTLNEVPMTEIIESLIQQFLNSKKETG